MSFLPSIFILSNFSLGLSTTHLSTTHTVLSSPPPTTTDTATPSSAFGFFLLLSYLFSIQDLDLTIASPYGNPVLQIFADVFGEAGATGGFAFIIICVWLAGLFSITSNSRMVCQ